MTNNNGPNSSKGADRQLFGSHYQNLEDNERSNTHSGRRERDTARQESGARSIKKSHRDPSGYKESTGGSKLEQVTLSSHGSSNK